MKECALLHAWIPFPYLVASVCEMHAECAVSLHATAIIVLTIVA